MKHSATRALALLKTMNLRAVSSVRDLAADTGISKPSVVRLLAILIEDGYVQRSNKIGSYMLTENVLHLATGFRQDSVVERAARTPMDALTAQVGWPTALGMFEQGAMVVRYSTIPTSPLAWYRTTIHQRLPLLGSAMGVAFLAFSPQHVREELLASASLETSSPIDSIEERFQRVRAQGYAIRAGTAEHPTFSLSVPIRATGQLVAALSITIFGRAMTIDDAVTRYLGSLRDTAFDIGKRSTAPDQSMV